MMTFRQKDQMEKTLNRFFSKEDRSKHDEELLRQVEQEMEREFGNTLNKINQDTGNIDGSALNQSKNKSENAIKRSITETGTQLETIYNRMNAIEIALTNIKDAKKYDEINAKIDTVYHLLNQIILDGKKKGIIGSLRSREFEKRTLLSIDSINKYTTEGDGKGESILTIINSLLKNADLFSVAVNLQKGTLFEHLIAVAPAAARLEAGDALEDHQKGQVKGFERDKITIDFNKNNFTKDINLNSLNQKIKGYKLSNYIMESYGYSQGKLDVEVVQGGQTVPISAKNVNLSSGYDVHIVSGTSLLYLLQDEDSDFVNNYFNAIAKHKDNTTIKNLNYAHEAAKMTILFKALTGKTFGRDSDAEVFVINDNKTGKVKVYDMKDLLNKIYTNLDVYSSVTANEGPIDSLKINNRWSESGYSERITNFIAEVHSQKISAALKPSVFK